MKGVSEVIAIILILMITISLAGLAYMFMSTTMSDVTSSAGSTVDTTTSSMRTSFVIESVDVAKAYIRNTGQNSITNLSVYVNDEPAIFNVTAPIAAGAVGTVTIYSFIPDGATVKVTSPSGFSTSKIAQPCSKAVGCWKFDEGSGTMASDSTQFGNDGILVSGPTWTSGQIGNAISLNGTNFVEVPYSSSLCVNQLTIIALIKTPASLGCGGACHRNLVSKQGADRDYNLYTYSSNGVNVTHIHFSSGRFGSTTFPIPQPYGPNTWHFVALTVDSAGLQKYYSDGNLIGTYQGTSGSANNSYPLWIGKADNFWNGIMDEVRIYNKAIY